MYTTASKRCTAHVTLKRGRVKEYSGRSVHLKSGQEFEIELYNPHTRSVLAKIYLNGIAISGGGLVIRPGQRVYLERYLDDNRKFKFDTYEVENTRESVEAIAKNGDLRVEFYYEQDPPQQWYNGSITIQPNPWWLGTTTGGYVGSSSYTSDFSSNVYCSTANSFPQGSLASYSSKSLETGRVEKGGHSSQGLVNTYENFNSWYSESETIKILPYSQKPHEVSTIRNYCSSCSARVKKSSWKFCPYCQASLTD